MAFPSIFSTYFDVSLLEIGTSSIVLVLFNLKVAMASTLLIRDLLRTLLNQNTFHFPSVRLWTGVTFHISPMYSGIYAIRIIRGPISPSNQQKTIHLCYVCMPLT